MQVGLSSVLQCCCFRSLSRSSRSICQGQVLAGDQVCPALTVATTQSNCSMRNNLSPRQCCQTSCPSTLYQNKRKVHQKLLPKRWKVQYSLILGFNDSVPIAEVMQYRMRWLRNRECYVCRHSKGNILVHATKAYGEVEV